MYNSKLTKEYSMEKPTKNFYLTNKDMLREIHNSKMSYCWTRDENYTTLRFNSNRL